ncbi:MAG: hypothetical protein K1X61_13445 [Chitinophagales bacterium]|nr:hypothetical protein [Chitinophagales bacterium]
MIDQYKEGIFHSIRMVAFPFADPTVPQLQTALALLPSTGKINHSPTILILMQRFNPIHYSNVN